MCPISPISPIIKKTMIEIKNITKSFGSLQVLKGIDLHIGEGQDTDGNRALLVMTHSDEIALIRDDTH